jgi:hypothetical protein
VVDWARVRGTVRADFDDVVVAASASLPAQCEAVLGTVPVPLLQPYDPALLAGFGVEVYQVGLEAAFDAARDRVMLPGIREAVRRDIGGDEQRIVQISPRFSEIRFRHLLLPVWLLHYRWGDQLKQVVVNGHSGAVVGDRPWSWWKADAARLTRSGRQRGAVPPTITSLAGTMRSFRSDGANTAAMARPG